jgi:hypothetical protein
MTMVFSENWQPIKGKRSLHRSICLSEYAEEYQCFILPRASGIIDLVYKIAERQQRTVFQA